MTTVCVLLLHYILNQNTLTTINQLHKVSILTFCMSSVWCVCHSLLH